MSKIPRQPQVPSPTALGSKKTAAAEQHDKLVRLVWRNVDRFLESAYAERAHKFAQQREPKEIADYLSEAATAAKQAETWAAKCTDGPLREALGLMAKKLRAVNKAELPALTEDLYMPLVKERRLAAPIQYFSSRDSLETVGHIDVAVNWA